MSYKNLEIWKLSKELVVGVHNMTINDLPKFEMYEEGSQVRRSVKSIRSNIAEGYGRRKYKGDFIKFLIYSYASCLETQDHLEIIFETGSLTDKDKMNKLWSMADELGKKINRFIQGVEKYHNKSYPGQVSDETAIYQSLSDNEIELIENGNLKRGNPKSNISYQISSKK